MKKSLENIIALLKDIKKVRNLTVLELCILREAEYGIKARRTEDNMKLAQDVMRGHKTSHK